MPQLIPPPPSALCPPGAWQALSRFGEMVTGCPILKISPTVSPGSERILIIILCGKWLRFDSSSASFSIFTPPRSCNFFCMAYHYSLLLPDDRAAFFLIYIL